MKKLFIILPLTLFEISCTNVQYEDGTFDVTNVTNVTTAYSNKEESLSEMIAWFMNVDDVVDTRSKEEINIKEIDSHVYKILDDKIVEITDEIDSMEGLQTAGSDIYQIDRVSFSINDTEGYAFLSEDERIKNIFFFTEKGSVADTAIIEPLKAHIESIPQIAAAMIVGSEAVEKFNFGSRSGNVYNIFTPIVRFSWDQGYPFNMYAPSCDCISCSSSHYNGHNPAGCTVIALAQAIATIGVYHGKFYRNNDLYFNGIPSTSSSMNQS